MIDAIGNLETTPMIHHKLKHEGYWLFCMKCGDMDLKRKTDKRDEM